MLCSQPHTQTLTFTVPKPLLFKTLLNPTKPQQHQPQGYEVMYLTDVLDEYVMQQLPEYEDFKFVNIAKEDIEHLDKVRVYRVHKGKGLDSNKEGRQGLDKTEGAL